MAIKVELDFDAFMFGVKRFAGSEIQTDELESVWVIYFGMLSVIVYVEVEREQV